MAEYVPTLRANYDDFSDVLYLSVGNPIGGVRTSENAHGLLERRTGDGALVGVTIENFDYAWRHRHDQLAAFITDLFTIDRAAANRVLEHP